MTYERLVALIAEGKQLPAASGNALAPTADKDWQADYAFQLMLRDAEALAAGKIDCVWYGGRPYTLYEFPDILAERIASLRPAE